MSVALYWGLTVHSTTGASVTAIHSFKATEEFYDIQQQIQQPTLKFLNITAKLDSTKVHAHPKEHYLCHFDHLRWHQQTGLSMLNVSLGEDLYGSLKRIRPVT